MLEQCVLIYRQRILSNIIIENIKILVIFYEKEKILIIRKS
jgi:hypothetical protein